MTNHIHGVGIRAGPLAGSLWEMLYAQAQRDADAIAILAPGRVPLSFGALLEQIDNVRMALNGYGLGHGDRVALFAGRGPESAVAALGIACWGACVPLNAAATTAEIESGLRQTGVKALLVPASAPAEVKDLAPELGILLLKYFIEEGEPAGRFHIEDSRSPAAHLEISATATDIAFVLRTSGTSARSKIVPINHSSVVAGADKSRRMFSLGPDDRCLNLMPLCYYHGLNTGLISPLAAGCAVICPPTFDAKTFFACMSDYSPTWYTASFTYHQVILEWLEQRPNALGDHRLRFVRSSSGPLSARIQVGLERILGTPVLQAYGTTETGTIAANPPVGLRKPETVGFSPDNDFAIMDASGKVVGPGIEGEIVVRGPTVFGGYENDPAANRSIFRDGWYRTGDQGIIDADGYARLIGRLDEMINRGGEKIAPREIDEALLTHDDVAQAVSFPIPHATLHQELASVVVLQSDALVTADELRRFVGQRLAPFKVPRIILCAAEIPKGPTGKLNRRDMAAYFGLDGEATSAAQVEIPTKIQEVLLKLWREVLKRPDIGCDDDFFLLGGDSLSGVDLLHRIEEELQYQLPLTILTEAPTVRKFEDRLEKGSLGAASSTVPIHTAGTLSPVFAIFGRYGHVIRLIPVLRSLELDKPTYGLQPPGMDWSGTGCTTVPEMAAHYIREIKAVQPRGPYSLLGVSFGGLMAFEVALQLQRSSEVVESLALVDTTPPNCLLPEGEDLAQSWVIEDAPPRNAIEAINSKVAETHLRARHNYILDARLEQNLFRGELIYFYCDGNAVVAGHDRRRLWQRFVSPRFRLLCLPGNHGDVDKEPQFTALRNLLRTLYSGEALPEVDPASVFDRDYRIEIHNDREMIVSSTGKMYVVDKDSFQGCVVAINSDAQKIQIKGWAVESSMRRPAETIVVFLDDRFIGYGASGVLREDAARYLPAGSTKYSGFDFYFGRDGMIDAKMHPRLFVLSPDNSAAELPMSVEQNFMTWAELLNSAAETEKMRAKLEDRSKELEMLKNTISWRITRPLRYVRHIAAPMLGKLQRPQK